MWTHEALHWFCQTYADAMDAGTMTLADVLDAVTALPVQRFSSEVALSMRGSVGSHSPRRIAFLCVDHPERSSSVLRLDLSRHARLSSCVTLSVGDAFTARLRP